MVTSAVPISVFGGAAGATVLWRHQGALHLTVVVKAALELVHDAPAQPRENELLQDREIHRGQDEKSSLELPCDLDPVLPCPEVLLFGTAHAATPTTALSVRLFVGIEEQSIVDKTLHVYGDRLRGDTEPRPFTRLPLVYERAPGGPGSENPAGRGARDPVMLPNVVDPRDPWRIAGFGPLSRRWPSRSRLAPLEPRWVGTLFDVPDAVPLEYFQTAPEDQRTAKIIGDEWLVIDGMHPTLPRFQTQLPGFRARARFVGPASAALKTLELSIDRLVIDMNKLRASLTWRAHVPVVPEQLVDLQVVAGLEQPELDASLEISSQTMVVTPDEPKQDLGKTLPFAREPSSNAPAHSRRNRPVPHAGGLPFAAPPSTKPAAQVPVATWHTPSFEDTVTASPEVGPPPHLPFSSTGARPSMTSARAGSVPSFHVPSVLPTDEEDDGGTLVAPMTTANAPALPFVGTRTPDPSPAAEPPVPILPTGTAPLPQPSPVPQPIALTDPVPLPVPVALAEPVPLPQPVLLAEHVQPKPEVATAEEIGIRKTVLDKVRAGEAMFGLDLDSADLSGLDLSGAVLSEANLSGAKLVATILEGARLSGARLVGADMSGARMASADLSRAELSRATLSGADLTGADLTGSTLVLVSGARATFDKVRAERANLSQGRWEKASFAGAILGGADFSGAELGGARFDGAMMGEARLVDARGDGASFRGAMMDGVTASGASLHEIDLSDASAERSNWERAELDRGELGRAKLRDSVFARASLLAASFAHADMRKVDLSGALADGADFTKAVLEGGDLRQAKMGGADCAGANLSRANAQKLVAPAGRFEGADFEGTNLRFAKLKGADLTNARLADADFRDADLEGAKLKGADRSKAKLGGANLKDATLD